MCPDLSWRVVACVLIRKSNSPIRVQGSIKEGHVTFTKNHASSFTKIRSRQIVNVKGHFLPFEVFRILILCCRFTFILIVAVVTELTSVPFQQPRHCLLVNSWRKHKIIQFCYPVATRKCSPRNLRSSFLMLSCIIKFFKRFMNSMSVFFVLVFSVLIESVETITLHRGSPSKINDLNSKISCSIPCAV